MIRRIHSASGQLTWLLMLMLVISFATQSDAWAGRAARGKVSQRTSKAILATKAKRSQVRKLRSVVRPSRGKLGRTGATLFRASKANVNGLLRKLDVKPSKSANASKNNSSVSARLARTRLRTSGKQRRVSERKTTRRLKKRVKVAKEILTQRIKNTLAQRSRTRIALALGGRFAKTISGKILVALGGRIVMKVAGKAVSALAPKIKGLGNHPAVRTIVNTYVKASAALTRQLDRWQAVSPPKVASAMGTIRKYSIPSMAAFLLAKVKSDKKFLGGFFVANSVFGNLIVPAMVSVGLNPAVGTGLHFLTTPIAFGVVIAREYYLRRASGESVTMIQVARSVLSSYTKFAGERFDATRQAANSQRPVAMVTR